MNNWYESSIKSLIELFLSNHGFAYLKFDPTKPWNTNMQEWHQLLPSFCPEFDNIASNARSFAFDKKYGAYSYITDYRSVCDNWNHIILNEIQKIIGNDLTNKNLLAVGANNGSELSIIFQDFFTKLNITVVEISKLACINGQNLYPSINFLCCSMDEVILPQNYFDIFISLRAAYCAGNNLDFIVKKAISAVKPGGIIIFSISNGYIDISTSKCIPIKGVYNPENQHCDETETQQNISWMKNAMLTNGCKNVIMVDAESEILLITKR